RTAVVGGEVLDAVAVLGPVVLVRRLGPRRRVDVDIPSGQALVERCRLGELGHLDRVALVLEDVLHQVRGGQPVGPGGQVAQGDGAAPGASAVLAGGVTATVVRTTAREDHGGSRK